MRTMKIDGNVFIVNKKGDVVPGEPSFDTTSEAKRWMRKYRQYKQTHQQPGGDETQQAS